MPGQGGSDRPANAVAAPRHTHHTPRWWAPRPGATPPALPPPLPACALLLQKLLQHAPLAVDKPKFTDPHTKVNALVQVRGPHTAVLEGAWCT